MVRLQNHFGIAVREEAIALGCQFTLQLPVVIDTAVEDDAQPQVGVDHGLLRSGGEIDDA
jgi:hypothetical protein